MCKLFNYRGYLIVLLIIAAHFLVVNETSGYGLTGFNWNSEIPFNGSGDIEYEIDTSGLTNRTAGLTDQQAKDAIVAAFNQWDFVSNLSFQEDTVFTDDDILFKWDTKIYFNYKISIKRSY